MASNTLFPGLKGETLDWSNHSRNESNQLISTGVPYDQGVSKQMCVAAMSGYLIVNLYLGFHPTVWYLQRDVRVTDG